MSDWSDAGATGAGPGAGAVRYGLTEPGVDRAAWERMVGAAARHLCTGGLVAFPTETVYGLGADALQPAAVRRLFAVKGRPADNPLIVHVARAAELDRLVRQVPSVAQALIRRFWPGPLTLVMERSELVPDEVTAGLATVAVRMPDHPVALAFIERCGTPIAAPSANRSGRPSPTTAEAVAADFPAPAIIILDGGPTAVGIESTVVDVSTNPPVILRPGGITAEALAGVLGAPPCSADGHPTAGERPRSPGLRYRHYAPAPPVVLVYGTPAQRRARLLAAATDRSTRGEHVGVLAPTENAGAYPPAWSVVSLGPAGKPEVAARRLFAALRRLEEAGADVIFAEALPEQGIGVAVMNRLKKAASVELGRHDAGAGESPSETPT